MQKKTDVTPNRYRYKALGVLTNQALTANGKAIIELDGLLFSQTSTDQIKIENRNNSNNLVFNGDKASVTIPLAAGQTVTIVSKASGSTANNVECTNAYGITKTDGTDKTTAEVSNVFSVAVTGEYTFKTSNNGIYLYSITTTAGTNLTTMKKSTWSFYPLTETTQTALTAEVGKTASNWSVESTNRFTYLPKGITNATLSANGTAIAEFADLTFSCGGSNSKAIILRGDQKAIQLVKNTSATITLPSVEAGSTITIKCKATGSGDKGISIVTDAVSGITKTSEPVSSEAEQTDVFSVSTAGTYTFKCSDGGKHIYVNSIKIEKDDSTVKEWASFELSEATMTNLNTEINNAPTWTASDSNRRFYPIGSYSNKTYALNETEFEETKGITFTVANEGRIRLDNQKGLYIIKNGEGSTLDHYFTMPSIAAGSVIVINSIASGGSGKEVSMKATTETGITKQAPESDGVAATANIFTVETAGSYSFTSTSNANGIYVTSIVVYEPQQDGMAVAIGSTGYATFSAATEVQAPEDVEVYYVKDDITGSTVNLTKIDSRIIPGNEGVILKAVEGTYYFTSSATSATLTDNQLKTIPYAQDVAAAATGTNYVLAKNKSTGKAVFASIGDKSASLSAGMAYLYIPAAGAPELEFIFDGDSTNDNTTGVSEKMIVNSEDAPVYNLNGQRVARPGKGLYIVNGKKYIVK